MVYIPDNIIYVPKPPSPSWFAQRAEGVSVSMLHDTWKDVMKRIIDEKRVIKDLNLVWDLYCGCTGRHKIFFGVW